MSLQFARHRSAGVLEESERSDPGVCNRKLYGNGIGTERSSRRRQVDREGWCCAGNSDVSGESGDNECDGEHGLGALGVETGIELKYYRLQCQSGVLYIDLGRG